jgi:nitrogen-specific signal transduction histidine kinase
LDVIAQPDWLRQVFLNLMLNSVDAFKQAKKANRYIDLVVAKPSERQQDIQMTYKDNATGINPQSLSVPEDLTDRPFQQQLFEPGVTSKKAGSGFGLWLVRRSLDDHHGSIDLTDHRNGVAFSIHLPKPETALLHPEIAAGLIRLDQ